MQPDERRWEDEKVEDMHIMQQFEQWILMMDAQSMEEWGGIMSSVRFAEELLESLFLFLFLTC